MPTNWRRARRTTIPIPAEHARFPRGKPPALARRLRSALRETFGLTRLRPGQQAVIERVMGGAPTLASMPTGAGKSLCYQLPTVLLPGLTVVVSPLIALMKDQCEAMRDLRIEAVITLAFSDGTRRCFQPDYVARHRSGRRARQAIAA